MLAERLRCVKRRYANAVFRIWVGGGVACSPADAGGQLNHDHRPRPWAPAFAGEQGRLGGGRVAEARGAGNGSGVGGGVVQEREWWGRGALTPKTPPPRRRPGPNWGASVTEDRSPLLQPFQLDPGLRRGGVRVLGQPKRTFRARPSATAKPRPVGGLRRAGRAHALSRVRVSSSPCRPKRSSRSTASCRAVRCRFSRSDAPTPACAPPSARAGRRGCRG